MTKDDIIKLAREVESEVGLKWCVNFIELERFATLVTAAEREACAAMFDDHNVWDEEVGERIRARGNT